MISMDNNMDNLDQTGQHYMIDKSLIKFIVDSANLKKTDIVLEVGYGKGALTRELVKHCKVIAIDIKHYDLGLKNVVQIDANILDVFEELYKKYEFNKIVSNIPYNISEPLMRKIFKTGIETVVLTVGEDFGKTLSKKDNRIGIIANDMYSVEILKKVSPKSFRSNPRVDSVVARLLRKSADSNSYSDSIYSKLVLFDDMKLKNAFEKIFAGKTKREIRSLTNNLLFSKRLYELSNEEFVALEAYLSGIRSLP